MKIIGGMSGDGYNAFFDWVFVLTMAATRAYFSPTVLLDQLYEIANFHLTEN